MMKHLKVPLIATAAILALTFVIGLGSIALIYNSDGTNRQTERAGMAGAGVATACCIAIAPFWFVAAVKIGKEKRRGK
jgi:cytochrome bd-type quinol oxidase subunit 2